MDCTITRLKLQAQSHHACKHSTFVCRRPVLRTQAAKGSTLSLKVPESAPTVTSLEWTRPLQIIKYPHPKLRAVNAKISIFDDKLLQLAKEMIEVMYEDDGVGLAAPQVGVNVRLMVFNPDGRDKPGNESILVNPEIVSADGNKTIHEEGCLSFPQVHGDVERPKEIVVKAQNEKGEAVQLKLSGWVGRIFQHEYDHLQGILFHDRMKPAILETVRPALIELEEQFVKANPGVKIQRLAPAKVNKGFGAPKK